MNRIYNQKKFLKGLTEDEFKTLLLLGYAKFDEEYHTMYHRFIKTLDDLSIEVIDPRTWGEVDQVRVTTSINKLPSNTPYFYLDDFNMTIVDYEGVKDLSSVLHAYLTYQYAQTYIEALYKERMKEASREKAYLLDQRNKIDEQLLELKLK